MTGRAVITGIGTIAATGIGTDEYWKATQSGVSGILPITGFDASQYLTRVAGQVQGFDPTDHIPRRLMVATDRWTHFALAATQYALDDAAFDPATRDPWDVSVVTASSSGGNEFGQREIQSLWAQGPQFVTVYQSIAWFYAATTGQVSIKHGMKGACGVVVSEGAGGLDALGVSRRQIRRGGALVVSGGTEAPVSPYALACQLKNGLLSPEADPVTAYRPFDAQASGYVPGEGGAILIVEGLDHARDRGAPTLYAEIAGYGATHDGYQPAAPAPDGEQYARAMRRAIADAQVTADDIDVVFADGMGTRQYDAIEARALTAVFGDRIAELPVTVPKSMVGRLHAGGAALDVAAAALAIRDSVIPPTVATRELAEDCPLNLVVGDALPRQVTTALVAARGYGGFNSAVVLRRVVD